MLKSIRDKVLSLDEDLLHHVCIVYCNTDRKKIAGIVSFLRDTCKMDVFDPSEGHPGKCSFDVFQLGFSTSKHTILYITKEFLSDPFMMHIAAMAVMKFVRSKAGHRVIPLLLESCKKLPEYIRVLRCVAVWKYELAIKSFVWNANTYRSQLSSMIIKTFTGPPPSYKKVKKIGLKEINLKYPRNWKRRLRLYACHEVTHCVASLERKDANTQLMGLLGNVIMSCPFGRCHYMCKGTNYMSMCKHQQLKCDFIPRKCANCNFTGNKNSLVRHNRTCTYHPVFIKPPESFGPYMFAESIRKGAELSILRQLLKLGQSYKHKVDFENRQMPKAKMKSKETASSLLSTDKKTSKSLLVLCPDCNLRFSEENFEEHQRTCKKSFVGCGHFKCNLLCPRGELEQHMNTCRMRDFKCKYADRGCDFTGTTEELAHHLNTCKYCPFTCPKCKGIVDRTAQNKHVNQCQDKFFNRLKKKFSSSKVPKVVDPKIPFDELDDMLIPIQETSPSDKDESSDESAVAVTTGSNPFPSTSTEGTTPCSHGSTPSQDNESSEHFNQLISTSETSMHSLVDDNVRSQVHYDVASSRNKFLDLMRRAEEIKRSREAGFIKKNHLHSRSHDRLS